MTDSESQRLLGFAALGIAILGNAAGNILLKLGAGPNVERVVLGLVGWQTLAGIACFALNLVFYAWALKQFDLHVVQIIVSLQYVVVIALAALLLGEQITLAQWSGITLIAIGLFICSR
jgi:drug/metabolite transporter (DMT)-like permease